MLNSSIIKLITGSSIAALLGFLSNALIAKNLDPEFYAKLVIMLSISVTLFSISEMDLMRRLVSKNIGKKTKLSNNKTYQEFSLIILIFTVVASFFAFFLAVNIYKFSVYDGFVILLASLLMLVHKYKLTLYQFLNEWFKYNMQELLYASMRFIIAIFLTLLLDVQGAEVVVYFFLLFCLSYLPGLLWNMKELIPSKLEVVVPFKIDKEIRWNMALSVVNVIHSRIDILLLGILFEPLEVGVYAAVLLLASPITLLTRSKLTYLTAVFDDVFSKRLRLPLLLVTITLLVIFLGSYYSEQILTFAFTKVHANIAGLSFVTLLTMNFIGFFFISYEVCIYKKAIKKLFLHRTIAVSFYIATILFLKDSGVTVELFAIVILLSKVIYWLLNFLFVKKNGYL